MSVIMIRTWTHTLFCFFVFLNCPQYRKASYLLHIFLFYCLFFYLHQTDKRHHGMKLLLSDTHSLISFNCWNVYMSFESNKRETELKDIPPETSNYLFNCQVLSRRVSGLCIPPAPGHSVSVWRAQETECVLIEQDSVWPWELKCTGWWRRRAQSCRMGGLTSCSSFMTPYPVHDASKPTPSVLRTVYYCTYSKDWGGAQWYLLLSAGTHQHWNENREVQSDVRSETLWVEERL